MSTESYIDSVRLNLVEQEIRSGRVEAVGDMLGHLVNRYFEFDNDGGDECLQTRTANINPGDPGELVWFRLLDENEREISRADAETVADKVALVSSAQFMVFSNQINRAAFTITTESGGVPGDVIGWDGQPLATAEIDGVIVDLERYGDELAAQPPGR